MQWPRVRRTFKKEIQKRILGDMNYDSGMSVIYIVILQVLNILSRWMKSEWHLKKMEHCQVLRRVSLHASTTQTQHNIMDTTTGCSVKENTFQIYACARHERPWLCQIFHLLNMYLWIFPVLDANDSEAHRVTLSLVLNRKIIAKDSKYV